MPEQSFEESLQKFLEELKNEDEMTEKQRNILKASIKLFATKGFHATSTSEIAKEAGVAEGTIFRHYKSKKDILIATVAPMIIKFAAPFILKDIQKILSSTTDKSFEEILTMLYRNRLELVETNTNHVRIIIQEAFFHDEIRTAMINSLFKKGQALVLQVIEQKIAAGELRPLPPEVIFRMAFSAMIGVFIQKYIMPPEQYQQHSDEEHIAITVDILMNGLRAR